MTDDEGERLALPVGPRDHARGPADAAVTLLEYGDFECPQCTRAYPIVGALEQRFAGRLRFVFRHFPLTNAHPHAQAAAEAAEWAAAHGRFWEMYDAIYGGGARLSEDRLLEIAVAVGGAPAALSAAWRGHTFFARVKEDFRSGIASGVTGTPTFFIDGRRHAGSWEGDALARAISDRVAALPDPAPPERGGAPPR
jgi:protein-disulfide isomerase